MSRDTAWEKRSTVVGAPHSQNPFEHQQRRRSRMFLVAFNGLALGEEADFKALNCQPSTKFDTR